MTRRRRSVLGAPGHRTDRLHALTVAPADGVFLDLEGTVGPDHKETARDEVCRMVAGNTDGAVFGDREVAIRINPAGTPWHDDDLAAALAAHPDAVIVPKLRSAADVAALDQAMTRAGAPDDIAIWAMIETPQAVINAAEIASSPRLAVLVTGTNDLAAALGVDLAPAREPLLAALSWCVFAARSAGRAVLDGVFNDADDHDGFVREATQGRSLGFDGKTLIAASQVEATNIIFTTAGAPAEKQDPVPRH